MSEIITRSAFPVQSGSENRSHQGGQMFTLITRIGFSLEYFSYTLSRRLHGLGGILLAFLMFLTAFDVIGRYVFNRPITGTGELTEMVLVVLVFLGVAHTGAEGGHIKVELILSRFSEKTQRVLDICTTALSVILMTLITWQAVALVLTQIKRELTTAVLFIPVFPFAIAVAIGCGLLSLVLLAQLLQTMVRFINDGGHFREFFPFLLATLSVVVCTAVWLYVAPPEMDTMATGVAGIAAMLGLLLLGMPIGFAMGLMGFAGMLFLTSYDAGLTVLRTVPFSTASSYSLSVLPLFILMGAFAFHTGISKDLYTMAYRWLGHMPGGLAMATIGGCAGFAAVSGSSLATAATMGTVALPEMKRYKYDQALSTGAIAAGGSIGILIPPSVILVIYGILTNQPITKLFIAGFIPGIMEAVFYILTIYILCKRNPRMGPPGERTSFRKKFLSLKDTWGAVLLFCLVIGGLYMGIFTPTEAAGVGAFGAFIMTIFRKQLSRQNLFSSLKDSAKTSAMAFTILIGAMILGYFLTLTNLPFNLADYVSGLNVNRYIVLVLILALYIVLGCMMDSMSIMILTVPIFFPVITTLGFDPIWFGILIVRVVEIGMITPPMGINVFIIKGVAPDVPMQTIFRGILPFLAADIIQLMLLLMIPEITLWLPRIMGA